MYNKSRSRWRSTHEVPTHAKSHRLTALVFRWSEVFIGHELPAAVRLATAAITTVAVLVSRVRVAASAAVLPLCMACGHRRHHTDTMSQEADFFASNSVATAHSVDNDISADSSTRSGAGVPLRRDELRVLLYPVPPGGFSRPQHRSSSSMSGASGSASRPEAVDSPLVELG